VTDANLLLGRLNAGRFLGGGMTLDRSLADRAMQEGVAAQLGLTSERAAQAVVQIADTMMSFAVRAVSVERGVDPRDCTLIAFGGAGPLHAVAIAREIGIPHVAVPRYPGTFSALGMLLAGWRQDFVQTFVAPLESVDDADVTRLFEQLAEPGYRQLRKDGLGSAQVELVRSIDLRYRGQDHALPVPMTGTALDAQARALLRKEFDALHERHYAHASPGEPVEIVNLRLSMRAVRDRSLVSELLAAPYRATAEKRGEGSRPVVFGNAEKPLASRIVWRPSLEAGDVIAGPAIVEEENSTTLLHPGDVARVNEVGVLMIDIEQS
jgi:N-methylhydantoinase A